MEQQPPLWQNLLYTFITVLLTVSGFIFYSVYTINGQTFMAVTGEKSVLDAVDAMGGLYVFGTHMPIWSIILVETGLAFFSDVFIGGPAATKLSMNVFNPQEVSPVLFQTTFICATVGIMCPLMSFYAAWIFYPYNNGFNFWTLIANWFDLVIHNFPFAYFIQIFLIQPILRGLFGLLFWRKPSPENGKVEKKEEEANEKNTINPIVNNEDNDVSDDPKIARDAVAL